MSRKTNWKRRGLPRYINPDEEKKALIAQVKEFHVGDKLPRMIEWAISKFSGLEGFLKPKPEQTNPKP